jgi:hypothetical protein
MGARTGSALSSHRLVCVSRAKSALQLASDFSYLRGNLLGHRRSNPLWLGQKRRTEGALVRLVGYGVYHFA